MNILCACEESQEVTFNFRVLGHNAFSCDILNCSGGFPEWHILSDVEIILNGNCGFFTCDGKHHFIKKWDMIIGFPPCTFLTTTGNSWFNEEKYGEKARIRKQNRAQAIEFFLKIANANCDKIAIENPVGIMSTVYKKPSQIIQPYMFGDPFEKRTCLWLKGLKNLVPSNIVQPEERKKFSSGRTMPAWYANSWNMDKNTRAKYRSKTFPGIAEQMAKQWG